MTTMTTTTNPEGMGRQRVGSSWLFAPVDIAPLVLFRIGFGALMLWEVWRYFHFDRIARYYMEPTFVFPYFGFEWLSPLPGDGMIWLFHGIGALSVLIMLGAFYRVSMTVFWLCFTYVFLLDKAQYLNHFYLISLVSFLMIFVPAHRTLSVDALLRPRIRSETVPAWSLWLLRGQMAVVYVFGGIAKINPDWLAGEPMRGWMAARTDFPLIGGLFTEEWLVYLFSYGGMLLDLFIVPFLLWPRTRIPALILAITFHLMNARLFNIGIFPWFAIAATLLFLPPAWFRLWPRGSSTPRPVTRPAWIIAGLIAFFAVQIMLPLRHFLYPGDPSWTEEGHTLAWHMRLRDKDGEIAFYAGADGMSWPLTVEEYLSPRQYDQMKDHPEMILRFVHHLAREVPDAQIHVWAMISLNSRAPQLLIDPTADLTRQRTDLRTADWILPLTQRPYPHEPIPTLLVSRRYADVLVLINVATAPVPLDRLIIDADGERLDFGTGALQPGDCLLVHTQDADLTAIFTPCNEAGPRQIVSTPLESIRVGTAADGLRACDGPRCVVTSGRHNTDEDGILDGSRAGHTVGATPRRDDRKRFIPEGGRAR
jgi:hypothetical protein